MNFTQKNLEDAVNENILSFEQSEKLIEFLNKQPNTAPKFDFTHLASDIFKDSWLFPITLTLLGLVVIYLGVLWQKNELLLASKARSFLPPKLGELLE